MGTYIEFQWEQTLSGSRRIHRHRLRLRHFHHPGPCHIHRPRLRHIYHLGIRRIHNRGPFVSVLVVFVI